MEATLFEGGTPSALFNVEKAKRRSSFPRLSAATVAGAWHHNPPWVVGDCNGTAKARAFEAIAIHVFQSC